MKLTYLFSYFGPNRRSDSTLVEAILDYEPREASELAQEWETALQLIHAELATVIPDFSGPELVLARPDDEAVIAGFAGTFTAIAIYLQQGSGHKVFEQGSRLEKEKACITAWFEHDEASVGRQAAVLALKLLDQVFTGIDINFGSYAANGNFRDLTAAFVANARRLVQPADTSAIISAAQRQGVPVIRLERDPYKPVQGDFRIRMNSMLMLGHSARRQVIDGTFALEKSADAHAMIKNRQASMQAAARTGLPVPAACRDFKPLLSVIRGERAVRQLGYPVVVKTATRGNPAGTTVNVTDPVMLNKAVSAAVAIEQQFMIEKFVPGDTYKLLLAGHELIGVLSVPASVEFPLEFTGEVHPSAKEMAISASRQLDVGLLVLTIVTPDISEDLALSGGAVTGVDVAPRLDRLLGPKSEFVTRAADNFVRWLVPSGRESRIPVISVTGTNGKTTTSRMIAGIMNNTGVVTGMQCTDGRYVGGRLTQEGDDSALTGHFCLYEDPAVQLAVMENHHVGIATTGFAFNRCDVAVCTNVSDDHMQELGVETVADMAVLKRALIERARDTAVLNADNTHCLAMIPFITARRTCLISMQKTAAELAELVSGDPCCCVLEDRAGMPWIVVYEAETVTDIVPVNDIPATFGGLVKFNVLNAMQAIAATFAMGADPAVIRDTMSSFEMSMENTPNRLNFYPGMPFQLLVDFAHNPDGIRRLAEFTDAMEVTGRRILVFSGTRTKDHMRRVSEAAAGHFDHYVVMAHTSQRESQADERPKNIPAFIESVLVESGVPKNDISIGLPDMEAVAYSMEMAAPGDLVVLLLRSGAREQIGNFLKDYSPGHKPPGQPAEAGV